RRIDLRSFGFNIMGANCLRPPLCARRPRRKRIGANLACNRTLDCQTTQSSWLRFALGAIVYLSAPGLDRRQPVHAVREPFAAQWTTRFVVVLLEQFDVPGAVKAWEVRVSRD